MSNYSNTVGIDVSKATLDVHDYNVNVHQEFPNTSSGFKELLSWARKNNGRSLKGVVFCMEHTGMYSLPLAVFLTQKKLPFSMVPGLEIKKSMGMVRGKSDKIDAYQIARYAYLRREEIREYTLPSKEILKLKSLLSLREKMVKHRAAYQGHLKELNELFKKKDNPKIFDAQEKLIKQISDQITEVEKEILDIINKDPELKRLYNLTKSVKGVGLVIAVTFIVYTNCFTAFDTWRQFSSYAGIAPFEDSSGSSRKKPKRVHHMANKRIKALLSNAASTSIQFNPEMRLYYERRIAEGKSTMSTQNIIRNKIVSRVFAVVRRGTPYVDTLGYAA
jgi:transposase